MKHTQQRFPSVSKPSVNVIKLFSQSKILCASKLDHLSLVNYFPLRRELTSIEHLFHYTGGLLPSPANIKLVTGKRSSLFYHKGIDQVFKVKISEIYFLARLEFTGKARAFQCEATYDAPH